MDVRRSSGSDPSSALTFDLAGMARYLADAVRHGATPDDEAVLALAGWAEEELDAVAPAAYMMGDDELAINLLSRAAFGAMGDAPAEH